MKSFSKKAVNKKVALIAGLFVLFLVFFFLSNNTSEQNKIAQTPPPKQPKITLTPKQKERLVPAKVLVRFRPGVERSAVEKNLRAHNAEIVDNISGINTSVLKVPAGKEDEVITSLYEAELVDYAERSFYGRYNYVPNDASVSQQYSIKQVQAEQAWDITKGNGVKIAIIDSGVDLEHPDLKGKIVASQDFSGSGSMADSVGHGTHVAGILGANTNNAVGIAGMCPDCQIIFAKQGDKFDQATIAKALIWTADQGAKAVNMSFGSEGGQTMTDAVAYVWNKGTVPVAAPANEGKDDPNDVPSALPNVLSVAATDSTDKKADFSNYGSWVTVAAPGGDVYSTLPGGKYGNMSGTSMAAPAVAGIVGLIASTSYGTTPAAITQRICDTADKITGTGTLFKCGRINAFKAVQGSIGTPVASTSAPTAAVPVPSQTCLGSCPTIPVAPTTDPYAPPALPIGGTFPPTTASSGSLPSTLCGTTTYGKGKYKKKKHKKKKQGSINQFMYMLLLFIMQLIEQMNKGAGGTMPVFPTNPCDVTTPTYPGTVPTVDPAVPTIDPFVPTLGPAVPTIAPTVAPTLDPNAPPPLPTVAPTASMPTAAPTAGPTVPNPVVPTL